MALYFSDFDEEKTAFVNPWDTTKKQADFPSVAVYTFSDEIVEDYVKECTPPDKAKIYNANGYYPAYQAEYKGEKIALFVSRVGETA